LCKKISNSSKSLNKKINIPQKIADIAQVYIIDGKTQKIIRDLKDAVYREDDTLVLFSDSQHSEFLENWIYSRSIK